MTVVQMPIVGGPSHGAIVDVENPRDGLMYVTIESGEHEIFPNRYVFRVFCTVRHVPAGWTIEGGRPVDRRWMWAVAHPTVRNDAELVAAVNTIIAGRTDIGRRLAA